MTRCSAIMKQGNGDSDLTLFGRDVTPNHHALAEQFVLLDNMYCNGEVSVDGHQWCDAGIVTDHIQRSWVYSYSGKGSLKDTPSPCPSLRPGICGTPASGKA